MSKSSFEMKTSSKKKICNFFSICDAIIFSIGILLILSGIGIFVAGRILIKQLIHENSIISQNSSSFKDWVNAPADIFRKYYFFHVNNSVQVENGLEKPYLIERGPYVYREVITKTKIVFNGTDIVTYSPVSTFFFEPSMSNGTEKDFITVLNVPATAMIEQLILGKLGDIGPSQIDFVFLTTGVTLFINKTINELMTGYVDRLLAMGQFFRPDKIKTSSFSLMNNKNGTGSYNISVMTGKNTDITGLSKIVAVDGSSECKFWNSPNARLLNGTDGSQFEPFVKRNRVLRGYYHDICRSYSLVYKKDSLIEDIQTYDYHFPSNIFYGSDLNPENEGFCENNKCLGNGVFNMSACSGMSSFISLPHFMNAEEKFFRSINGLMPNEDKHDFVYHIEPILGVPIKINARLQVSFYLYHHKDIRLVKFLIKKLCPQLKLILNKFLSIVTNIESTLFPVLWIDEDVKIYTSVLEKFKELSKLVNLAETFPIGIISIGLIIILALFVIKFYCHRKKKYNIEKVILKKGTQENTKFI